MPATAPPKAFVTALKHLLRPLARAMISHGITLSYLTELLKHVYVEAASEFQVDGKRLTHSRISLLTGVHRKDVKRLQEETPELPAASKAVTIGSQVVARWTGDEAYIDAQGEPRPLPRNGPVSFDSLVEAVNKDMRPRTLLDEWLRQGMVNLDEAGHVVLNAEAFVPSRDFDDLAYYYGHNLHDHILAATHNLEGGEPPFLERATYYTGLRAQSVDELETLSKKIGMDALVRINKTAMKYATADLGQEDADQRFTFGVYFLRAPDDRKTKP